MTYTVQRMDELPSRHKLKWAVYENGKLVAAFKTDNLADAWVWQVTKAKKRQIQIPETSMDLQTR